MNKTFRISRIRATHNRGYLTNEHEKLDEESDLSDLSRNERAAISHRVLV